MTAPVPAEFSVPSAALVANATTILQSVAPHAFVQFQNALVKAEQQSHVSQAAVSALAQDEAAVEKEIGSAGVSSYEIGNDLNLVQDFVDYSFTYESVGFRVGRSQYPLSAVSRLDGLLGDVPAVFDASGSENSVSPIDQLTAQIEAVAKQSRVTPALDSALKHSYKILSDALGPNPNTMPGPGGTSRDPLVVYYDAQINRFV